MIYFGTCSGSGDCNEIVCGAEPIVHWPPLMSPPLRVALSKRCQASLSAQEKTSKLPRMNVCFWARMAMLGTTKLQCTVDIARWPRELPRCAHPSRQPCLDERPNPSTRNGPRTDDLG